MIINNINFDNTKSIKDLASTPEVKRILNNIPSGEQQQLYHTGQKCSTNGINNTTITDSYKQNGYCYYIIQNKHKNRIYTHNVRQQDIKILV